MPSNTGNGNHENMLEKLVKLLQVNLFLAGFSHFGPLCAASATASKKLRRSSAARPPLVTNFATTAMIAIVHCVCTAFRLGDYSSTTVASPLYTTSSSWLAGL